MLTHRTCDDARCYYSEHASNTRPDLQ